MRRDQYKIMFDVEESHFWYEGMNRIVKSLIQHLLNQKHFYKILDAGCGTGESILQFRRYGSICGIDISNEALHYCKLRGIQNVSKASIEKIPYKNRSFDIVLCFDVLGHKEVKYPQQAMNEIYRVLRPGGYGVIRVPAYNWLRSKHDVIVQNERRYSAQEFLTLLKGTKFSITRITYANTILFPIIALKRTIDKRLSISNSSDVMRVPILLNIALKIPLYLEAIVLKLINLPFGLSLIIVVRKQ